MDHKREFLLLSGTNELDQFSSELLWEVWKNIRK